MTTTEKKEIINQVIQCLSNQEEVRRIVVFGSFFDSEQPRDLDLAVFQNSSHGYYDLALKYRRILRPVARRVSMDVIPICQAPELTSFRKEIEKGKVIYEN